MAFTINDESFLNQPFVKLFEEYINSKLLEERITGLDSAPALAQIDANKHVITSSARILFEVNSQGFDPATIREGLSVLFGHGFLKSDYNPPLFAGLTEEELLYYMRLAIDIWDTRIHTGWMQNYRGHANHNNSKTLEFERKIASGDMHGAKQLHHTACVKGKDSPHHVNKAEFEILLENRHPRLEEIFDDQASVAGRYFRKAQRKDEAHIIYQRTIFNGGVVVEDSITHLETYWLPDTFIEFMAAPLLQEDAWRIWKKSNIDFCRHWIKRFGYFNENWTPPVPLNRLPYL